MSGTLINDLYKNMHKELKVLAEWFHGNKLSLADWFHYGIILWGSTYKVHTTKLFIMQTKTVCAILQTSFHEHSHLLFAHLNLIKLQDIYHIVIAKFMDSYIHSSLPVSFSNIFTFIHDIHNHDTRQLRYIRPISSSTIRSSNSILYKGPLIWKKVPYDIKRKRNICIKGMCFKWL